MKDGADATVLELGARGKHRGAAFTLAGRTTVKSDAGGLWNEWVLAFDDGRKAFLSEAAAGFTLFAERPFAPSFESLAVGEPLGTGFVVVERGRATRIASWGDVPAAPRSYRYADLSSISVPGEIATIDYGDGARAEIGVFLGQKTELAELGLAPRAGRPRFLPAPSSPTMPKGLELFLDVGDEGELPLDTGAARFRVLGIMHRSIRIEGERFTWEEYVLHSSLHGLRWLVLSDGHWNLVAGIEPGSVTASDRGARHDGTLYKPWSSGKARLEWAKGELPWTAKLGDTVDASDYVHAPYMLSCERTPDEVNWARATYLPPDVVAKAFTKRVLPKPSGRAPNQPRTQQRR